MCHSENINQLIMAHKHHGAKHSNYILCDDRHITIFLGEKSYR